MQPEAPRPHVVIIGGYLTEPLFYGPMRERLLERGAARVTIAPLHLPDWLGAALVGFGPALLRGARAIREARRSAPDPLIVIGHSAGGVVARLAMSPVPLDGRLGAVAEDVGCLVTLGTPHTLRQQIPGWEHEGLRATRFLERTTPGAWFAPRTAYLTVGSTRVRPASGRRRSPLGTILGRIFGTVVSPHAPGGGDGLVPDADARLGDAPHVALDVLHGVFGGPWYGDAEVMDRWWPRVMERWPEALATRELAPSPEAVALETVASRLAPAG